MDMIRFFITWGPTFLFVIIVLCGILIGCLRGFRKSLILFIHMLAASVICLIVYLCIVNNPNLDSNMVKFINGILGKFGGSLQKIFSVDETYTTLHEMIMQKLVGAESENQTLQYWLIKDNGAYINALVDMGYHLVIAILCYILYGVILFILYIVYLCAYPVRRKIKRETRKYQHGEINRPYKRRRLLGSLVGGIRATFTCIIYFSFLGSLIYIVSGGTNLPQRDEYKEEGTVEFQDQIWNEAYDYYSSVCAMGNTGIFQILNSIRDTNNTPFYFYFADIVLQGRINDETLGVENEKFYIRDEMGEYVHFINSTVALLLKYGNVEDIESLVSGKDEIDRTDILIATLGNEGFAEEFSKLVDKFEGKPFMTNLCLSTLTSLVNHIELAVPNNELVVGLVNQLFKSEDGIKVSDLATEEDIKSLFKGLVQAVAEVNASQSEVTLLSEDFIDDSNEEVKENIFSNKQMILIAKNFIPVIQNLSLFSTRTDVGNKIIQGLYTYASTSMVTEEIKFEVPDDINWIHEFNILLNACDPLLTIAYEVYDNEQDVMIENLAVIFEGENASAMEAAFDGLSEQLESSLLLDVVFKSSIVGKQIDQIVLSITKDEDAKIPKGIDYVGKDGECAILLSTIKILLKNGGGTVLLAIKNNGSEQLNSSQIKEMLEVLTKEITIDGTSTTLIKNITNSKLVYYIFSTYLTYADFGDGAFKLYIPENAVEIIEDCKIIKHSEIDFIVDLLSNCIDLIVEIMDHPTELDYAHIFSNEYIKNTVHSSLLLQGTLSNVIIGVSSSQEKIILPITYDKPESWISEAGDGEMCILLDAIFASADITIEGGKYLINELLNGNIHPSFLLNIEKRILDQLCSSKVLRYTISDMVTDLNGFQIVVARASLEEVNALTTNENKLVNVIQAAELSEIFVDIQRIVSFEGEEAKINYSAIFKNKAELCKSKTITATLIQLLLDQNEAGFLVIPIPYQEDFEKFKTDTDLTGNVWLGASNDSLDDEMYLMLAALETFIDKDENGNLPNEFEFETLAETLKIKEEGIDDICASAILNASVSKKVTQIFYVPTHVYINDVVEQKALNDLFKAVFKLFNRSEILVKELDNDLFDLTFRTEATPIILNSIILRATITSKMNRLEEIKVPEIEAVASEFVDKEAGYIVNQEELTKLFAAMFKLLESDMIMVNDLEQNLTGLLIPKNSISYITNSHILSATVSANLTKNDQLVILENVTSQENLLGESGIFNIHSDDLNKLLNVMFIILGTDSIVVEDINNQFNDLSLSKNDIDKILESSIASATISKKIAEVDELSISKHLVTEEATIQNTLESIVEQSELHNLLSAMFVLLDTEHITILNLNTELSNIEITKPKVDSILKSEILQLTISDKFIGSDDLIIPSIVTTTRETLRNAEKEQIVKEELKAFFDALLATSGRIYANTFELNHINLPTTKEDADLMTASLIVSATLSSKIMTDTSSICVIDERRVFYTYQSLISLEKYIEQEELSSLLLALTVGIGLNDPTNLSFTEIAVPTTDEKKQALTDSEIIRATISQKVLNQDTVHIDKNSSNLDTSRHYNRESVGILSKTEILNIIRGLELLNPENGSFDHLVLNIGEILRMPNKEVVLKAISESDIYLYIISTTLGEETNGIKAYQMFTTIDSTVSIEGIEYVYQQSLYTSGRYVINYPVMPKEVYSSFNLAEASAIICERRDVLALQNTIQYTL